ncbi:MAG: hypothetical protein WC454_04755, partial [Phycisphaerae bacterium]
QVRDGLIVVRDGKNTFELVAERPAQRSLLKGDTSSSGRITGDNPPEISTEVQINAKETEVAQKRILAETNSGSEAKEIAAARKGSVSDLENMRISTKEARGLGRLGRRLKNVQQEPNRAEDNSAESDANLNDPDLNDVNITGRG